MRKASKNGKERVGEVVQGRYFTCRARTFRGRSLIDFDLHPGNHDLRREVQNVLWHRHVDYCSAFGYRSKIHTHFSKTSIMCEVKEEHSEEWFSLLWRIVSDVDNLSRIRCEFLEEYAREHLGQITAGGILIPRGKVRDGELMRVIARAFKQIVDFFNSTTRYCIPCRHVSSKNSWLRPMNDWDLIMWFSRQEVAITVAT